MLQMLKFYSVRGVPLPLHPTRGLHSPLTPACSGAPLFISPRSGPANTNNKDLKGGLNELYSDNKCERENG